MTPSAVNERWSKAVEEGLIPTDDAMGIMTEELSPAAEAFVALAEEAGFTVESSEYFCFRRFPERHRTDGHEYITFVGRKPAA